MFDNVDDAFKALDEKKYWPFADALASYRDALMAKGFTREESMSIVKKYAKFIYEWAIEEALGSPKLTKIDLTELNLDDLDLPEDDDDDDPSGE
jgi:TPP-dependent pyruvate/acetoin dehydrogenase alpha subunit